MRPPTVQVIYANKNDGRKEGRKLISLSLNLEAKAVDAELRKNRLYVETSSRAEAKG
jgi:hypothetical protein